MIYLVFWASSIAKNTKARQLCDTSFFSKFHVDFGNVNNEKFTTLISRKIGQTVFETILS